MHQKLLLNQLKEEKKSERQQLLGRYTNARTDALVRQAELVKESEIAQDKTKGEDRKITSLNSSQ